MACITYAEWQNLSGWALFKRATQRGAGISLSSSTLSFQSVRQIHRAHTQNCNLMVTISQLGRGFIHSPESVLFQARAIRELQLVFESPCACTTYGALRSYVGSVDVAMRHCRQ
ncbi:unnamed protein product [Ectocarpus sp. 8 AP-2014]